MIWFGTDWVALGCILGGAAIGGAATLAMTDGGGQADARCAVEARMAVSPRIAISDRGRARAILVTPDVRVHAVRDCAVDVGKVVEIHLDNHLEQLDTQLEFLDQALELQMQQLEIQLEAELGQEMDARLQFEKAMQQVEVARLKVVLEKVEGGGI